MPYPAAPGPDRALAALGETGRAQGGFRSAPEAPAAPVAGAEG